MALILLCEEDIDPTGSDVRCVRNDRICDIILQLYLSAQCQITPLTKNDKNAARAAFLEKAPTSERTTFLRGSE